MHNDQLKNKLIDTIRQIDDEAQLQLLNEAAEAYVSKPVDILDTLTPEQLKRLEEAIDQAATGKVVDHETARKLSKEWLTR